MHDPMPAEIRVPSTAMARSTRGAVEHAAEDIHAGPVGAEQVAGAGRQQIDVRIGDHRPIGHDPRREQGDEDDADHDRVAEREGGTRAQHGGEEAQAAQPARRAGAAPAARRSARCHGRAHAARVKSWKRMLFDGVVGEALQPGAMREMVAGEGDEHPGRFRHHDLLRLRHHLHPRRLIGGARGVAQQLVHLVVLVVAVVDERLRVEIERHGVADIRAPRAVHVEDHRLLALATRRRRTSPPAPSCSCSSTPIARSAVW